MPQEVYCGFQVTGDDRMGQKSKPKKIPRASNKTSENPTLGWVLDPDVLKWKNRGLWTVCLGKMRQRVDRRQPFFLRLSWQGTESKKVGTGKLNRGAMMMICLKLSFLPCSTLWFSFAVGPSMREKAPKSYDPVRLHGRTIGWFSRLQYTVWSFWSQGRSFPQYLNHGEYCTNRFWNEIVWIAFRDWIPGTNASKQLTLILFDVRIWWTKFKAMRVVWRESKFPSLRRNKVNIGWSLNIVCPQYKVTQKIHA